MILFTGCYKLAHIREFGYSNKSPGGKFSVEIYSTNNFFKSIFNALLIAAPGDGGSGRTRAYALVLNKDGKEIGNTGNADFLYNEIEIVWDVSDNKVYNPIARICNPCLSHNKK